MRQSGSGIAWQGFSQVRLSHLTCHPASVTLSSQFNLMRHVRSAGLMASMHREDPARQAVLPTAPFPARGPGRSCYPKRTTPGTRRAELDDLWTPTRFGNLIILRAESAIWPWQHLSADSLDAQGAEQPDLLTAVGDRRVVLTGTDRRFMLSKVIHVGIGGG